MGQDPEQPGLLRLRFWRASGEPEGARRLAEAVEAYRQALTVFTRDDLPQDWATTQDNLGNMLQALGERQGGAEGSRRLAEAVDAYRQALTIRTRDDLPQQCAMTQNNLGQACARGAGRAAGGSGEEARRLAEAVEAYRQALTVFTRDYLPQDWARTQNNLVYGSGPWASVKGSRQGLRRLNEAVEAHRQALTVFTRDDLPRERHDPEQPGLLSLSRLR